MEALVRRRRFPPGPSFARREGGGTTHSGPPSAGPEGKATRHRGGMRGGGAPGVPAAGRHRDRGVGRRAVARGGGSTVAAGFAGGPRTVLRRVDGPGRGGRRGGARRVEPPGRGTPTGRRGLGGRDA